MRNQDRLLTRTFTAVLPLVIWGAHFFCCYAVAAVACQRGRDPAWVLGAVSVLAVGAVAVLFAQALRRACREREAREGGSDGKLDGEADGAGQGTVALHDWATLVTAGLALVAIAWSCVPMLMVDLCAGPGAG